MKRSRTALSTALGLGLAVASLAAAPAATTAAPPAAPKASAPHASANSVTAAYTGGGTAAQRAEHSKVFAAIQKIAAKKQAAKPGIQAVTITYNDSAAPRYQGQISQSTQIWNSSVNNVKLQETAGSGDFSYREGNSPRGSYAQTDGRGHGYVFIDYRQSQQYNSLRIVSHETGHILGLPDHYQGPCSELMSGGGPGPSCTNARPNPQESARVDQLWRYGLSSAFKP